MGTIKEIRTEVENLLVTTIYCVIGMDRPSNHDEIVDFIAQDILETADPNEWHSGDVAIGFRRWIEAQVDEVSSTEPDKQRLVDALIDVLAEDIEKGDITVLDELLLKMPYDVLKYALPEDMWADFEDPSECVKSGQHLKSCDDDGFCNNCGFQDDFINDEELLGEQ